MALAFIAVGLAAGSLAVSLGIGGGIIYVPSLVALFAIVQQEAQGTSLAVILPTAMLSAYLHGRAGRVEWRTAILVGIGGVVGALIGARVALSLEAPVLRRMFAILLVITAIRMLRRISRSATAPDA